MTASEQRLGIGFAAILLIGGAFVGLKQLQGWKHRVDVRSMTLDSRRAEAKELLETKDFWEERSAWLAEKQPLFTKRSDADLSLVDFIRDSAGKHDVTTQVQPTEPIERAGLTSANMQVSAKGEFKNVMRWLHSMQAPASFISISSLTLVPDEQDTSQVNVTMKIQKWFRLPPA